MVSAMCFVQVTTSTSSQPAFIKKPFLLLEVLISILVVSLCLVPFIQGPILTYREEMHLLEEMERARISELSFLEAKEKLLNREIPWDRLPSRGGTSSPISLSPVTLEIPGSKPKQIKRSFTLHCTGEKDGLKGEIYRIYQLKIAFNPPLKKKIGKKKMQDGGTYRVIVQKVSAPTAS